MPDSSPTNRISGRNAFIELLRSEGVTEMFGNPGTTELPVMHALTDYPDMGYTLGLQESVVIAMADGYVRASGKLAACNVHVAPGLGNAMGTLYTAYVSGTPLIVTAGQQEQGHGLTEPLLYAPLVPIASPVVKWATEVTRLADLPRTMHRAAKVAMTEPTGPVFISLPGDILNDFGAIEIGEATRVDTKARPSDETLRALAEMLLAAEKPLIIAGHEIVTSDAFDEAGAFADALGAPVYQQTVVTGAHFPSEHPLFLGQPSRDQKQVRALLEPYDTLICVGSDVLRMSIYSEVDPLPPHMKVIQIGQRDWEMGKNYAAAMAVRADVKETLKVLTPLLAEMGGEARAKRNAATVAALADRNWTATKAKRIEAAKAKAGQTPMSADWLMMSLCAMLPDDVVVVDEGITTAAALNTYLPYKDRYSYLGNVSGGIGWGIAAAVGAQIAQPERRVVAVIGDGSAMYSIQALWSAASRKLPVVFVLCNNGGYRIIKQRLKAWHGNDTFIGMDFKDPPIDATRLAEGFGLKAHRVDNGADFETRFAEAMAGSEPVLIEVMVEGQV
ncbi:benzoylformate decarboxylase [Constrictibacter sp. MBR-5]|jgi:benzoylformate decarboxylase|uniref:thiamine pyrophosphate-binding protein n=1 Tax=Constrictibacter sp. MBR-5 TaxID=3156467 RepID=UPI003390AAAA